MAKIRQIKRLHSKDELLNRFQDEVIAALQSVDTALEMPQFTTATAPTPSAEWLGRWIRVKDPAADEQAWLCVRDAAGLYVWRTSQAASPSGSGFGPLYPLPGI